MSAPTGPPTKKPMIAPRRPPSRPPAMAGARWIHDDGAGLSPRIFKRASMSSPPVLGEGTSGIEPTRPDSAPGADGESVGRGPPTPVGAVTTASPLVGP